MYQTKDLFNSLVQSFYHLVFKTSTNSMEYSIALEFDIKIQFPTFSSRGLLQKILAHKFWAFVCSMHCCDIMLEFIIVDPFVTCTLFNSAHILGGWKLKQIWLLVCISSLVVLNKNSGSSWSLDLCKLMMWWTLNQQKVWIHYYSCLPLTWFLLNYLLFGKLLLITNSLRISKI